MGSGHETSTKRDSTRMIGSRDTAGGQGPRIGIANGEAVFVISGATYTACNQVGSGIDSIAPGVGWPLSDLAKPPILDLPCRNAGSLAEESSESFTG